MIMTLQNFCPRIISSSEPCHTPLSRRLFDYYEGLVTESEPENPSIAEKYVYVVPPLNCSVLQGATTVQTPQGSKTLTFPKEVYKEKIHTFSF